MSRSIVCVIVLSSCTSTALVPVVGDTPTATITSHVDGQSVDAKEPIVLTAQVQDADDEMSAIGVYWRVGGLESCLRTTPDSSGNVSCSMSAPAEGDSLEIELEVVDSSELRSFVTIQLWLDRSAPPVVTIDSPLDGTAIREGAPVQLSGVVTDPDDTYFDLEVWWASDLEGGIGDTDLLFTEDGRVTSQAYLSEGVHLLSLSARDAGGNVAVSEVLVEVGPPCAVPVGTYPDASQILPLPADARGLALADLDDDGEIDIVAGGTQGGLSILWGESTGPGQDVEIVSAPALWGVEVADLNSDGRLDVVAAAEGDNAVYVMFAGDGSTGAPDFVGRPFGAGDGPFQLTVFDADEDGHLDVVTSNSWDDSLSILLNDGTGALLAPTVVPMGDSPETIRHADLDHDGHQDLIVPSSWSHELAVLLGRGDGSFEAPVFVAMLTDGFPTGLDIGDLDGDGHVDAVVRDLDGVSVFRGAGDGTLTLFDFYAAGRGNGHVVLSDLTADGVPDVATSGLGAEEVVVFGGVGDGSLIEIAAVSAAGGPWSLGAADLNHDGRLDLVMSEVNQSDEGLAVSWALCD